MFVHITQPWSLVCIGFQLKHSLVLIFFYHHHYYSHMCIVKRNLIKDYKNQPQLSD